MRKVEKCIPSHMLSYAGLLVICVSACPPGFNDVGSSQCFIAYPENIGFCDGHKKCQEEGVKRGLYMFMVGRYSTLLRPHFFNYSTIHTGMHDLLLPFRKLKLGWQTNDPGHYSRVKDSIDWMRGEPRVVNGIVIVFTPQGFKTEMQDSTLRTLVCSISNYTYAASTAPTEFRMNWPEVVERLFLLHEYSTGCFDKLKTATIILCAARCTMKLECRAMYYNEKSGDCYHSMYIDSRLPRSASWISGSWEIPVPPGIIVTYAKKFTEKGKWPGN